jgi:hypothetical protein
MAEAVKSKPWLRATLMRVALPFAVWGARLKSATDGGSS